MCRDLRWYLTYSGFLLGRTKLDDADHSIRAVRKRTWRSSTMLQACRVQNLEELPYWSQ